MSKLFELIFHEVNRQFRSERSFYNGTLGITQRAWEKYKSGETNFSDIKLSTFKSMVNTLFTRYEIMLIDEAIEAVNYNWYDNVIEAFYQIKLKHAKHMLNSGADIEQAGATSEDGQPTRKAITRIRVGNELGKVTFEIKVPSNKPIHHHLRIPSGKRNRLEWFNENFKEVVVK